MCENVYVIKLIETFDQKPILNINVQFCCIKKTIQEEKFLHVTFRLQVSVLIIVMINDALFDFSNIKI